MFISDFINNSEGYHVCFFTSLIINKKNILRTEKNWHKEHYRIVERNTFWICKVGEKSWQRSRKNKLKYQIYIIHVKSVMVRKHAW